MAKRRALGHDHYSAPPNLVLFCQGVNMTRNQGWFYAGRLGTELKIGITINCPFCRMDSQMLDYLGIAISESVRQHESDIKKLLGEPSHGSEWFSDWQNRFEWLVKKNFINPIQDVAAELAKRFG